jgi:DNA-binding NarL/FixJ family response regulator
LIELVIYDEHPLLRAGVRTLIENGGGVEVVGEADTIEEAVDEVRRSQPDVVLMDVDASSTDTVEGMRRLRDEMPDGALVVLGRREDDDEVYRAVVGGAVGHVGENAQPEELVDTIRQAADGGEPISQTLVDRPAVGRRVLEAFAALSSRGPVVHQTRLSGRDLSILTHAAEGMTNQQIGRELAVSEHTVKSAISHMLARLGLRHRTEAVVHAMRNGWITPKMPDVPTSGAPDDEASRPGLR